MTEVIDFFFDIWSDLWTLILSNWIFSVSVLIILLNFVISLIIGAQKQ